MLLGHHPWLLESVQRYQLSQGFIAIAVETALFVGEDGIVAVVRSIPTAKSRLPVNAYADKNIVQQYKVFFFPRFFHATINFFVKHS